MKKINEQQIKAILDLLVKYNVGVNEYIGLQNLFEKLPLVIESNDDNKEPEV
jgi:hypothetical protein